MSYSPRALPPHLEVLADISKEIGATRTVLVGSALRNTDNDVPVTSYSLYLMPTRKLTTDNAAAAFIRLSGPGSRLMRTFLESSRYEIRQADGSIVNLNFCYEPWMMSPEKIARHVPNGLSAIAMDLFSKEIHVGPLYRMDREERTITQTATGYDPNNRIALSVQQHFPSYPIMHDGIGQILPPRIKSKDAPLPT